MSFCDTDRIRSLDDLRISNGGDQVHLSAALNLITVTLSGTGTRVIRVVGCDEGKLGLTELIAQLAGHTPLQTEPAQPPTDEDVEAAHRLLTEVDDNSRTLLMIEAADTLQPTALRYIQHICQVTPHLRLAFIGAERLDDLLSDAEFTALAGRKVTTLHLDEGAVEAETGSNMSPTAMPDGDDGPPATALAATARFFRLPLMAVILVAVVGLGGFVLRGRPIQPDPAANIRSAPVPDEPLASDNDLTAARRDGRRDSAATALRSPDPGSGNAVENGEGPASIKPEAAAEPVATADRPAEAAAAALELPPTVPTPAVPTVMPPGPPTEVKIGDQTGTPVESSGVAPGTTEGRALPGAVPADNGNGPMSAEVAAVDATMPVAAPAPPLAATGIVASAASRIEPSVDPAASSGPRLSLSPETADLMVRRADAMLQQGDVSAARQLYRRAADAGLGRAATAMGRTFDPLFLSQIGAVGLRPDLAQAMRWYRRALDLGEAEAGAPLDALTTLAAAAAVGKPR